MSKTRYRYLLLLSVFTSGWAGPASARVPLYTLAQAAHDPYASANTYWEQAQSLAKSGKYLEAAQLFEQAAAAEKASGIPRLPALAAALGSAGYYYYLVDQYLKAIGFYQQALEIERQLGRTTAIASQLNNLGEAYRALGQYEKAIEAFQQALQTAKNSPAQDSVATYINNMGYVYFSWGQYDKALQQFQQAVELDKKHGRKVHLATDLNNIGAVYAAWRYFDKALGYYQQALEIDTELGHEAAKARDFNNIGLVYLAAAKYEQAISHFQQAYDTDKKNGQQANLAIDLNNMAAVYSHWKQYDKAFSYYQQALAIDRQLGLAVNMSADLNNIGAVYLEQKQYAKALDYFQQALAIDRQLKRRTDMAKHLNNIGFAHALSGQFDKSLAPLKESVAILEDIRHSVQGTAKQHFMAAHVHTYQLLIQALTSSQDTTAAFYTLDQSKARHLLESLSQEKAFQAIALPAVQHQLAPTTSSLIYANSGWDQMLQFHLSPQALTAKQVRASQLLENLPTKYTKPLQQAAETSQAFSATQERSFASLAPKTGVKPKDGIKNLENLIYFYRQLLTTPQTDLQQVNEIGHLLYQILVQPHEAKLTESQTLQIVPDGILGLIPFETLVDSQGHYLIEKYQIRYVQSLSVWQLLQNRSYPADRKPMLALGGAVYQPQNYQLQQVDTDAQLLALKKQVWNFPEAPMTDIYGALYAPLWKALPGTIAELQGIQQVVAHSQIIKGERVNEAEIKRLSQQGELSQYKVLHFATHGLAAAELPELSALVLSQFAQTSAEDGYLRAPEIAKLKLQADFVNLSACETGLGKVFGGEGVVGLTQAFLMAGANGVSVSLWPVDDRSTSLFMQALYKQAKGDYGLALGQIKQRFLKGEFGERYRHPYYWAPFVYYGK